MALRPETDARTVFVAWWRFAHIRLKRQAVLAWNRITYFKMLHREAYRYGWDTASVEFKALMAVQSVAPDLPDSVLESLHYLNLPYLHHRLMPREILEVLENYSGDDLLPDKSPPGAQLIQGTFHDPL